MTHEHHELFVSPPDGPKSFCVLITLCAEGQEEAQELADALELLAQDNERWIQRMLEMGITPPCCAACGGVKYREPSEADYKAGAVLYKCAPDMFKDGHAACGSIAAYNVAATRQLEQQDAWIIIKDGGGGESSYHAIEGSERGEHDATLEMERG